LHLNKGDTIGIVATSGPFNIEKFNAGIKIIKSMGFNVFIPEAIYEKEGYLAGYDSIRLKTLTELFLNKDINGIFCARGGYGVHRIIDSIDYDLIKNNPKPLVGFSDVTALLLAINQKSGLTTFHGPVVTSLNLLDSENIERIFNTLSLKKGSEYTLSAFDPYVINPGSAEGTLIGGNLCILSHLMGTNFEPDFDGKLLFLEDVNEPLYKIDRMLTHLTLTGAIKNIKGLVLGSFKECGDIETFYRLIAEKFISHNIPILAGMGFGHGDINEILPIGSYVKLNTCDGTLNIKL